MGLVCDKTVQASICTLSEALAERLREMLLRWAGSECVSLSVSWAKQLPSPGKERPHLLILDVDSLELTDLKQLEKEKAGLIIISRDVGRMIRSYRWHPAAFLKPDMDERQIAGALGACEKHWRCGKICLESPYRRRDYRLPLGNVRYAEAMAHYSILNQGRQSVRMRIAINELAALLPNPPFVRCHRSYLVHLGYVKNMTYTVLTLWDGTRLPLGRTYVKPLKEALQAWKAGLPSFRGMC